MPNKPNNVRPIGPARPDKRGTRQARGYDQRHVELRKLLLARYPTCQHQGPNCTGWSTQAHHREWPATSIDSYMAVCSICHHEIERDKRNG